MSFHVFSTFAFRRSPLLRFLTFPASKSIQIARYLQFRYASNMAPSKRKVPDSDFHNQPDSHASKRGRSEQNRYHPNSKQLEDFGVILRDFYPPEV